MRPALLVCVGDLVEDVVVWPDGPVAAGTDNPSVVRRTRGGSAANVAVLAAPLVRSRFVGRVGDDALGDTLLRLLADAGVEARVQRAGRTGSIVVVVDAAGERTMYPDRGAAADLAEVPLADVAGAGAVHAPAYSLAVPASRATTLDLLAAARAEGALLSLDASSTALLRTLGPADYLGVVGRMAPDVLFANTEEAALLGLPASAPPATAVVVKNGPRPVVVRGADGTTAAVAVPVVAGVLDTTGAGDALAAGCLAALLGGAPLTDAVAAGCRLAASVLGTAGAASSQEDLP